METEIQRARQELWDYTLHPSLKKELSAKCVALAITALEQQEKEPKEAKCYCDSEGDTIYYRCPNCGTRLEASEPVNYCFKCGCKLELEG